MRVSPGFHQGSTRFCEGCGMVRGIPEVRFHRVPQGSTRIPQGCHKAPQGSTRVPQMFCKVPWFALEGSIVRPPSEKPLEQ